jgi:NAD(P)-dependent dehydrogenase (short-subunit alcohol dehydrogenase family)
MRLIENLLNLKGRTAFVTGAASGIGQSIATFLADAEAHVVLADLDETRLREVAAELSQRGYSVRTVEIDVSQEKSVRRAFEEVKQKERTLDILVNCAGIYPIQPLEQMPTEFWDRVLAVNLRGPMLSSREALGLLKEGMGATIVNVSSVDSLRPSFVGLAPYGASKAGLNALTRSCAIEYSDFGIRVNAVLPGGINTPGLQKASAGVDPAVVEASSRLLPMKRMGEPEDVAALVHFLASEAASFITGQTFVVDGGIVIKA